SASCRDAQAGSLRCPDHLLLPRIENSIWVLKCYPADAVQADYPFPFSNGWMTVVAASDFQSRPVIFCGRHSLLVSSNSGSGITPRNLEHRRVNVRSRKSEPIRDRLKSIWTREERRAMIVCQTRSRQICIMVTSDSSHAVRTVRMCVINLA